MLRINQKKTHGFTLIEIILVIIILGFLTSLVSTAFITSLKKGRDARRKGDLNSIKVALEEYYEDWRSYPTTLNFGGKLCQTPACTSEEKVYMQKVPNDPVSGFKYFYQSNGEAYSLFSCIENNQDSGEGVNQLGYGGTNCGDCGLCRYRISSTNFSL